MVGGVFYLCYQEEVDCLDPLLKEYVLLLFLTYSLLAFFITFVLPLLIPTPLLLVDLYHHHLLLAVLKAEYLVRPLFHLSGT